MIRQSVIVPLLALALALGVSLPAHAATRYRHMTIRAAAQLCKHSRIDRQYRISVAGYFRAGPENNGPDPISGGLFDTDGVPQDAARHIGKYHGISFGTRLGWNYSGSIDGITRPHAKVAVHGLLYCSPETPFLKPNVIAVSKPSRSH